MASNSTNIFGFELLYKLNESQIVKNEDLLILIVHWNLIKSGFKCLGIGDSKTIGPTEIGSELLPDGWNQASHYTLRYVKEGKLYILMGIKSEESLLLNLLRIEDHSVSNVQFPINTVKQLRGPLELLIPTYETVIGTVKTELIEPVHTETGREVATQTTQSDPSRSRRDDNEDPLRVGPPHRPPDHYSGPPMNPLRIGQDDLNPFGSGRGGMLFDPFSNQGGRPNYPGLGVPGRLPHGAVPPGARFDPFGPPDIDRTIHRREFPDADHFPPPDYDNMFM